MNAWLRVLGVGGDGDADYPGPTMTAELSGPDALRFDGDAAHPALSRRRGLGQTSARSLLLTLLGEFVLPRDEPVWTQVLIDVLNGLGVENKSARQALARTAAEGMVTSDRAGRRVRWRLTDAGRRLLSDGAARIYGFGTPAPAWDGRWLVLLVSVPETRRRLRHRLRTRLAWAGLGSPAPGVWLSPDPGKEAEVAEVVADLELDAVTSSFVGPFGAIGSETEVVRQAWDLAGVEREYEDFLAEFADADPHTPADVLTHQVLLVHAWRRFPFLDPELPAELLPEEWAGTRAAARFTELHAKWTTEAQEHWEGLVHRTP